MRLNISRRRAVTTLGLVVCGMLLTGCSLFEVPIPANDVQAAQVEGNWHTDHGQGKRTQLELRPDGTADWTGVPDGVFDGFASTLSLDWNSRTDYHGTWALEQDQGPAGDDYRIVHFRIDIENRPWGYWLYVMGPTDGRSLYQWLGDPDSADRLTFRRDSNDSA
ncbi:hypothetical protein SAMN04489743_1119 [Pseudarthrobacter equi]|uniref:Uncharacterized protein n=1 Tax=Pseudarthrobacter equi TaxID=728066 RepID=A0A1H1VVD8_9MICC|nr:hypothetical protein [Pseudarthrobacter equi]SDS88723.1 hypothetical protein SAMN04489743_1119 [Pseudarthrobacter equi]